MSTSSDAAYRDIVSFTKEELERMGDLGNIDTVFCTVEQDDDRPRANDHRTDVDPLDDAGAARVEARNLMSDMAHVAFESGGDAFADFAHHNRDRIHEAAAANVDVVEMLVLCYRLGVSLGSGACANDLGALYYRGDLVEQDYERAAALYELAIDRGCHQSIINLGYIYEYGRTGDPDHEKAYRCYALAAALEPSCEAAYKLGDMYARGKAVARDMSKAHALWQRALALADSPQEVAQPAVRIAGLLLDPDNGVPGLNTDPLRALALYQEAEIGLRIDIANGMTYYRKRLAEAVEGQQRARLMIEDDAEPLRSDDPNER